MLLLQKVIDYSPAEFDQEFPEIIFHNNSNIPDRTRAIIYNEPSPIEGILLSIDLFNENRVEVIAIGCITSYYYYKQISGRTAAEIINPFHLIRDSLKNDYQSVKRIGLLATTGTIRTRLFHQFLEPYDIKVLVLDEERQENLFMKSVYMKNGFKSAVISDNARVLMDQCVESLRDRGAELIIGGCTEVSVSAAQNHMQIPYLDVLDIMAKKMVERCYKLQNTTNRIVNG